MPALQTPVPPAADAASVPGSRGTGTVSVRRCPAGDAAYLEFARQTPAATAYHNPAWLDGVEAAFGLPSFRLLAEREGRSVGMLPLCHVKSMLFGNFLVSVPFGNFGGIVADDEAALQPLMDEAVRLAEESGARWIELRHIDPLPLPLVTQTRKVNQTLALLPDPDAMWKSLDAKVRNQVRKAEKSGLSARFTGREGIDAFYRVFARNMRDLGTPVYPKRFFEVLWNHLGDDALKIVLVGNGDAVMGGMVLMHYRDQVECPWASTLREFNALCPNMLMYWTAMRDACAAGVARFDFGTSDLDSGPYRFKKQWKADEQPLHRQYWLAPGQSPPHLNPSNPKYQWKIRMWQKLPLWAANRIGPLLARKLP